MNQKKGTLIKKNIKGKKGKRAVNKSILCKKWKDVNENNKENKNKIFTKTKENRTNNNFSSYHPSRGS